MQECVKVLEAQSRRNAGRELGGKQQCRVLCSQSKITHTVEPFNSSASLRRLVYYGELNCTQKQPCSALLRLVFSLPLNKATYILQIQSNTHLKVVILPRDYSSYFLAFLKSFQSGGSFMCIAWGLALCLNEGGFDGSGQHWRCESSLLLVPPVAVHLAFRTLLESIHRTASLLTHSFEAVACLITKAANPRIHRN